MKKGNTYNIWDKAIESIDTERPSIASIMRVCSVRSQEYWTISVPDSPFNLRLLEKNKTMLEIQIKKILKKSIKLKFKKGNRRTSLMEIIEKFDGEIII